MPDSVEAGQQLIQEDLTEVNLEKALTNMHLDHAMEDREQETQAQDAPPPAPSATENVEEPDEGGD